MDRNQHDMHRGQRRQDRDRHRKELGRRGEDIAAAFLEAAGLIILERNYRSGSKEVDIIAAEPRKMASPDAHGCPRPMSHTAMNIRIVEVKTRQEPIEAEPWESVRQDNQRKLAKAAMDYVHSEKFKQLKLQCDEILFDIISIVWNSEGSGYSIDYIPDAFKFFYFR